MRQERRHPQGAPRRAAPCRAVAVLALAGILLLQGSAFSRIAAAADAAKPVEIRAETMAAISQILAPYQGIDPSTLPPDIARAIAILRQQHFVQPPVSHPTDDPTDRLGKAMQLGNRTRQFLPELAALNDSLASGNEHDIQDAINALWQKAGRSAPAAAELAKLVAAARAAGAASPDEPQHATIQKQDYKIRVNYTPAGGVASVDVETTGSDGKLERTTFSGERKTSPTTDGKGLQQSILPDPPRIVTSDQSDQERVALTGRWIDQYGQTWDIAFAGDAVQLVNTSTTGHVVRYDGQWLLGRMYGKHIVSDPNDIGEGLPPDVRQDLAANYHPPFMIELEYFGGSNELQGFWISGQVTFGAISHAIKLIEDPTWDKPLRLTRAGVKVAQGGRYPEDGP